MFCGKILALGDRKEALMPIIYCGRGAIGPHKKKLKVFSGKLKALI